MTRHLFSLVSALAVLGAMTGGSPLEQAAAVLLLVALVVHRLVLVRLAPSRVTVSLTGPLTAPAAPPPGVAGRLDA